jgi:hypothetical protein
LLLRFYAVHGRFPSGRSELRFMSETQVDFDVDLRELQGQEGADTLCGLLHAIGGKLGKPALMTSEGGSQEHPVLGFDPALNKVILFTDPAPG